MKIEKLTIKNFKGIKSYEGDINGRNVYLCGGNGTGKTSFIDAVWCGLTGKNIPPEPTTDGVKKGLIEIDLGDFVARTKFTKGKATVFELENKTFTNESEKFIKAPRTYLESRIGVINFNIKDFFSKTDNEKIKYLCKILGVDFSDIDSEIEENEETRKFDKKTLAALTNNAPYYDEADAKKELVDIVAVSNKLSANAEVKTTFDRINKGVAEKKTRQQEIIDTIAELEIELYGNDKEQHEEGFILGLIKEIKLGEDWVKETENIPLNQESVNDLNKQLSTANETNKKITEAKEAKANETKAEELEKCIEENNSNIQNLKEDKANRLSNSLNIEGLVYDTKGERFLYNGLPFYDTQINTAAQLLCGMKIAKSLLKDLKIVKIDASLIDKIEFDKVLQWSEEEGLELFVELVDREAAALSITVE